MARTKQTAKKSIGPRPMQNHEITREDNIEERVRVLEKKNWLGNKRDGAQQQHSWMSRSVQTSKKMHGNNSVN